MQSYRGEELTFGKPLICSPAAEKRPEEGEERTTEQEEERAFTVSKRKAAITEAPS